VGRQYHGKRITEHVAHIKLPWCGRLLNGRRSSNERWCGAVAVAVEELRGWGDAAPIALDQEPGEASE
jgi:hypothetical protein